MRKVTIVVLVLMISCQVSEKPISGPVTAHRTMIAQQATKVIGLPAAWATLLAILVKYFSMMPSPGPGGCRAVSDVRADARGLQ